MKAEDAEFPAHLVVFLSCLFDKQDLDGEIIERQGVEVESHSNKHKAYRPKLSALVLTSAQDPSISRSKKMGAVINTTPRTVSE